VYYRVLYCTFTTTFKCFLGTYCGVIYLHSKLATFTATLVFLGTYCSIIYRHNSTMHLKNNERPKN